MKHLILLLFVITYNICSAQIVRPELEKDESGIYSISYIHNFYNRTEDVVSKVAEKFLKKLDNTITTPKNDLENKRYVVQYKLEYDNSKCKKCCVRKLEMHIEISVYYKDNRTKIGFRNIKCIDGEDDCSKNKTLEEYIDCKGCESNNILLGYIRERFQSISVSYKEHLKKASKDNSLF